MAIVGFAVAAPWIVGQFNRQDSKVPPIFERDWVFSGSSKSVRKLRAVTVSNVWLLQEVGIGSLVNIAGFRKLWTDDCI